MSHLLVVVAIGLLGGFAAGLQGPLAGLMGRDVGIVGSIFIVHLVGTLASVLFLAWPGAAQLSAWRSVPWYALSAGALGLVLIGALTFCIPRLGAVATLTLIIAGQMIVGACLDHFGLVVEAVRPFDPSKALGVVVLFVGVWLVVR